MSSEKPPNEQVTGVIYAAIILAVALFIVSLLFYNSNPREPETCWQGRTVPSFHPC